MEVKADKLYMQLNAAELEAIIKKKDSPSSNDRDAGFCSASSESEGGDDLPLEHPSQCDRAQETPVVMVRNKRKSMEPSKVVEPTSTMRNCCSSLTHGSTVAPSGPLKKRIRYSSSVDSAVMLTPPALQSPSHISHTHVPPAHVWDSASVQVLPREMLPNPAHIFMRHPGVTTLHRAFAAFPTQPEQEEPLALIARQPQSDESSEKQAHQTNKEAPLASTESLEEHTIEEEYSFKDHHNSSLSRPQQRNYKNMTRERRIEANARERTRVHTISAAYETLRRAVPAYASSQKLSKLSVLRVACSYILTLSRLADKDYSSDQSEPTIADCIEAINSTIQTEGKVKRKKEE
ncbi:uncharacterized protein LOC6575543 [Drosophila mojavensis]|uniref:BHLH domain-containing protein n=1 Tax=Drosophila mojavensis TaxID=7230 RepID=B4KFN1_DROMO|nr:uncharacterized protein LOC6575543 [Drosophila mojavensis]XP_043864719.1 uncharacterized protein LOC6575543 [Drosophila mojavensis]EDW10996.1 uncharacterized protein Dmoj_GI16429 [Drosophila mojavensis]